MKEYEIIGITKARKLLTGNKEVCGFLKYMGLFTKEITNFLMANGVLASKSRSVQDLFPHKKVNRLSTLIAGPRYRISYRLWGVGFDEGKKRTYPGACIYYHGDFFDESPGYPRIIYEVLDSPARGNPVNVLSATVERGGIATHEFSPLGSSGVHRYARRLSNLGFVSFDGKRVTPTEISRKIFSPEVKKVWETLKEWEHRIDVWP